jgi:hypothetical protein
MPVLPPELFRIGGENTAIGSVGVNHATGLSRRSGLACCSTLAKQELRSRCMIDGAEELKSVKECPVQRFGVEIE